MRIKKIIEFDGSYWHGSKISKYQQNKGREKERDDLILENGYCVLHIKEIDYYKDPEKEINKCLKFIYD